MDPIECSGKPHSVHLTQGPSVHRLAAD